MRYPDRGYGGSFYRWMKSKSLAPYNSWGNGSAMRTAAIGFLVNDEAELLARTRALRAVTHNHPEGIKGAQATAFAIFLARRGAAKEDIRKEISTWFRYDLQKALDEIRPIILSMSPARARFRRPSSPSWNPRIMKMRCARRSHWAATPTRWLALPDPSRRPITAWCPIILPGKLINACRMNSSVCWISSI